MIAHLWYMKDDYVGIGPQPIVSINITSRDYDEIMKQLKEEFEKILKISNHDEDPSWVAQLKLLYENPKDLTTGFYYVHVDKGKKISPASLDTLIPLFKFKNKTITLHDRHT